MAYEKVNWLNKGEEGVKPINKDNLGHMDEGILTLDLNKIEISKLVAVTDTAPTEFSKGDKYYNTTDKCIYTADDTNWGTTGEEPATNKLYVNLSESKLYYYDGIDFKAYGGEKAQAINEYSESTEDSYSCNYLNKIGKYVMLNKTNSQSVAAKTIVRVNWESESYNDTNGLLVKDGNVIKLTEGTHNLLIIASIQSPTNTGKLIYIRKVVDGIYNEYITSGSANQSTTITAPIKLNSGEGVAIEFYSETNVNITSSPVWNYFSVMVLD